MKRLFESKRFKAFLLVISALLLGMALAVFTSSKSFFANSAVGAVLSPVQKACAYVSEKIGDTGVWFRSGSIYEEKIKELEEQIATYEEELADYNQTKKKLQSCLNVLDIKEKNEDFKLEYATIIGRDSLDTFGSFLIDKGSSDNISVNDPVISGEYVVGVVHSVKSTYSVVWTLLNPKVNISSFESRTRESGYVSTTTENSQNGTCLMSGLEKKTKVSVGGLVCTSGLGGIYPKGLIIGKITEISDSTFDNSVNAVLKPGVNLNELEDVFIITDFQEQGISEIEDTAE